MSENDVLDQSISQSINQWRNPALICILQGDQLNMAVFFWYLGKIDLSSVHVYSTLHWPSNLLQGQTRPCLTSRPVIERHPGHVLKDTL